MPPKKKASVYKRKKTNIRTKHTNLVNSNTVRVVVNQSSKRRRRSAATKPPKPTPQQYIPQVLNVGREHVDSQQNQFLKSSISELSRLIAAAKTPTTASSKTLVELADTKKEEKPQLTEEPPILTFSTPQPKEAKKTSGFTIAKFFKSPSPKPTQNPGASSSASTTNYQGADPFNPFSVPYNTREQTTDRARRAYGEAVNSYAEANDFTGMKRFAESLGVQVKSKKIGTLTNFLLKDDKAFEAFRSEEMLRDPQPKDLFK